MASRWSSIPAVGRKLSPTAIVAALYARGLKRLLIEGGAWTVSQFIDDDAVDRLHVLVAPDDHRLRQARPLAVADRAPRRRAPPADTRAHAARRRRAVRLRSEKRSEGELSHGRQAAIRASKHETYSAGARAFPLVDGAADRHPGPARPVHGLVRQRHGISPPPRASSTTPTSWSAYCVLIVIVARLIYRLRNGAPGRRADPRAVAEDRQPHHALGDLRAAADRAAARLAGGIFLRSVPAVRHQAAGARFAERCARPSCSLRSIRPPPSC